MVPPGQAYNTCSLGTIFPFTFTNTPPSELVFFSRFIWQECSRVHLWTMVVSLLLSSFYVGNFLSGVMEVEFLFPILVAMSTNKICFLHHSVNKSQPSQFYEMRTLRIWHDPDNFTFIRCKSAEKYGFLFSHNNTGTLIQLRVSGQVRTQTQPECFEENFHL